MRRREPLLLGFLKWDLRFLLGLFLLLAVIVGVSLAQSSTTLKYEFDFGTGVLSDKAPNAINVRGGGTVYPTIQGNLTFGWSSADVQAISRGSSVSDLIRRDYNFSSDPENFRIMGLDPGSYRFRFTVGDISNTLSSRIQIGSRSTSITRTASWGVVDVDVAVASSSDVVTISFTSADGGNPWGVNGLQILSVTGVAGEPSFTLTLKPSNQSVQAAGVAEFIIEAMPVNSYGSSVRLSLLQALPGIRTEFFPSTMNTLPSQATLRFTTNGSTSPNNYSFTVRGQGTDAQAVTKLVSGNLTVLAASDPAPTPIDPSQAGTSTSDVPPKTQEQLQAEFDTIDAYVALERERILSEATFDGLTNIAQDLSHIPILQLPEPEGAVESSLQVLVRKGIISSTVDTAPIAPEIERPKPRGIWGWLFGKISTPAN